MLNFDQFEVVMFDCFGTLIDWESGILSTIKSMLKNHNVYIHDQELLELYARYESEAQRERFIIYQEILRNVVRKFGNRFRFIATTTELNSLVDSIGSWRPFPDTVKALKAFKLKYKLAVLSNVDDNLFLQSTKHLQVKFDWIITSQQVGAYKPSNKVFQFALHKLSLSPVQVLHIAQSLYHDIGPAKSLGISTVWVNRRLGKPGFGATPPGYVKADMDVSNLRKLVEIMKLETP